MSDDPSTALPLDLPPGVEVMGPPVPGAERVLTRPALALIADLQRRSGPRGSNCSSSAADARRRSTSGRA